MENNAAGERRAAFGAGFVCYLVWGFVPLAFQAIARQGVGPWETLAHRVIWGGLAALVFVFGARQGRQVLRVLREPKTLGLLTLSAGLIAVNWVVFIIAVNSGRVIESSLGYFITPLVNMAAGALIFRERLNPIGIAAIALALAGVVIQAFAIGALPVTALLLAASFGGYGVVRKWVSADAQTGLFVECLVLALPALAYIVFIERSGAGHLTAGPEAIAWLIASGPITAVPLALFAWAARRLPLSVMGFMQFIGPTIAFFIGIAQGEAFTAGRAISFGFIWLGAMVFIFGAWQASRRLRA
jgi:chloramphenicol-sensitive protein RarD